MDTISPFPQSSFFSVLGQVDGQSVCLGKTTCQKWMARLNVRGCACVRACTITTTAEADPVQVSPSRRLSLGSRVQRPCSNPSVGKSIPVRSKINKTSSKNLGGFRMSSSPDEKAVQSTANRPAVAILLQESITPAILRHPSARILQNQGRELRQTLLGELERYSSHLLQ